MSQNILWISLFAGCLASCKPQHATNETQPASAGDTTLEASPRQPSAPLYLTREFITGDITFQVRAAGEGSMGEAYLQVGGLTSGNFSDTLEIDGRVMDAVTDDLDGDGFAEVLLFTQSAGSGSYGNVIGYSVDEGRSMIAIDFPEITEDPHAAAGYGGHDRFSLRDHRLVREFPIYVKENSNSNPTGGTRQMEYVLEKKGTSRSFIPGKVSTLKK